MCMVKRVNFNMDDQCHALLKGVCALKRISVSTYIYNIIVFEFKKLVWTDPQVRQMFLAGEYTHGSAPYLLKREYEQYCEDTKEDPDSADAQKLPD